MDRRISGIILVFSLGAVSITATAYLGSVQQPSPSADLPNSTQNQSRDFAFENVTAQAGIHYRMTHLGLSDSRSGVYVADINNDQNTDILAVGGAHSVLYQNTGQGFERSDALPDLPGIVVRSAVFLDYNTDGWQDLLLIPMPRDATGLATTAGASRNTTKYTHAEWTTPPQLILLTNDGGVFHLTQRVTIPVEDTNLREFPMGATVGDYNQDGIPDVYFYQSGDWSMRTPAGYANPETITESGMHADNGGRNFLLRGTGTGFEYVPTKAFTGRYWTLTASFADLTGDGYADIYSVNDVNEQVVYVNQRNGTFRKRPVGDVTDRNGMASEITDINGDGRLDVFVTNILNASKSTEDFAVPESKLVKKYRYDRDHARYQGNNLLINTGNGTFTDRAGAYGVRKVPQLWGWAAMIGDLDNDGDQDLLHANNEIMSVSKRSKVIVTKTPPAVWERRGPNQFARIDGETVGFSGTDGRGVAQLDFDRDGDLDVLIAANGGRLHLYENTLEGGNSIEIALQTPKSGTRLGTRVYLTVDGKRQSRTLTSRTDFLSQDSRVIHFGVGQATTVDRIRIVWPDGSEQVVTDVSVNQYLVIAPDGVRKTVSYRGNRTSVD